MNVSCDDDKLEINVDKLKQLADDFEYHYKNNHPLELEITAKLIKAYIDNFLQKFEEKRKKEKGR